MQKYFLYTQKWYAALRMYTLSGSIVKILYNIILKKYLHCDSTTTENPVMYDEVKIFLKTFLIRNIFS